MQICCDSSPDADLLLKHQLPGPGVAPSCPLAKVSGCVNQVAAAAATTHRHYVIDGVTESLPLRNRRFAGCVDQEAAVPVKVTVVMSLTVSWLR